jgi:hypothetical protein
MADKYVKSTGSNTPPYDTWAKAATTLAAAVTAAAAGERIFVFNTHSESLGADPAYTPAEGVQIISTSDSTNEPPQTYAAGAAISTTTTTSLSLLSGFWKGFTFSSASGSSNASTNLVTTDNLSGSFENCDFTLNTTSASARYNLGANSTGGNMRLQTRNCTFTFGATGQNFSMRNGEWLDEGSDLCAGATVPTTLITAPGSNRTIFNGSDLSAISGTILGAGTGHSTHTYINCTLNASVTPLAALTVDASGEVLMLDCDDGDEHYHLRHYNFRGSTVISTSIVPSANAATYDGTNALSFVVAGNANASFGFPYQSPWIDVYHSGTSAITPYFEILRDGSSTAYTNGEVWGEWLAKVTSGSTRTTFSTDRRGVLTAAAAQADGAGLGAWTGENATSKSMKVDTGSAITPAEIGTIRGRVCVAGNLTVYVNPKILGISEESANVDRVLGTSFINTNITQAAGSGGGIRIIGHGGLAA